MSTKFERCLSPGTPYGSEEIISHILNLPVHTYSIVALDEETGRLGVAVQSHYFGVASIVPWVQTGVGAIATQSFADVTFGSVGLSLLRSGRNAEETLTALLATDEGRELRQLAIVDAAGNVAVHTGRRCVPESGHRFGDGYSVQANMMLNDRVPDAMAKAYEGAEGDLMERLLGVLEAAEEAGGDLRGMQAAGILISYGPDDRKRLNRSTLVDLRIDDHESPLIELRRLASVYRGYLWLDEATDALKANDLGKAEEIYERMRKLEFSDWEPTFWYAIRLIEAGGVAQALAILAEVITHERVWLEYLDRLIRVGHFPNDTALVARVRSFIT